METHLIGLKRHLRDKLYCRKSGILFVTNFFFSLSQSKSEGFILLFDFEMLILDQLLGEIVEIYIEKFSMAIEHIDWKV